MSRKFIKASPISAPLMRIIEDVYRRDLVVHFRVHVRVIVKALMRFDSRYIAKGYLFAGFDCLLSSIFEEGGLSITSVNMLQALPINITTFSKREHVALFLTGCCKSELARRRNHAARVL